MRAQVALGAYPGGHRSHDQSSAAGPPCDIPKMPLSVLHPHLGDCAGLSLTFVNQTVPSVKYPIATFLELIYLTDRIRGLYWDQGVTTHDPDRPVRPGLS